MDLQRIKDIDFTTYPVSKATLYRWHHTKRYPRFLIKFGGALCIDKDETATVFQPTENTDTK